MFSVFYPSCRSVEEFKESIFADIDRKRRAPKAQKQAPEPVTLPQYIPYNGSANQPAAATTTTSAVPAKPAVKKREEPPTAAPASASEDDIARAIDAVLSRPPKTSRRYDCIASDEANEVYVCRAEATHADSILKYANMMRYILICFRFPNDVK